MPPSRRNHNGLRSDYLPFGKPSFSKEEIAAVSGVLRSGWIGMGPRVLEFEQALAAAVGAPHVVAVSSCTAALFLALLVSGVEEGDEVVVPSLTWCSTANAALYLKARVRFCDVEPATLCAGVETALAAVTPRTKAVIVVHFGGRAVDVKALRARLPRGVALVEDAAHAFGARYPDGSRVGSSGNPTCFSFYANKNLSTGEGGAIALADPERAEQARSLRQHGLPVDAWKRFSEPKANFLSGEISRLGYKMNYTDLQAAIGLVQLRRQGEFSRRRLAIARYYEREIAKLRPRFEPLAGQAEPAHARHLFVVKYPAEGARLTRDEFFLELRRRNVGVSIHYSPLHGMPLYAGSAARLPETERAYRRILTLPISASMTLDDARYVVAQMREALA